MSKGGQAAKGAMGGAMAGGAIAGPYGALVGGVVGGAIGYFGDDPEEGWNDKLNMLNRSFQREQAPQATQFERAGQSQLMGNRAALIAQLEAQARGEGPSAARQQMQKAADDTRQMMASTAAGAGGRGVNSGAAMRNATNAGSTVMQKNSQDMGIMRAQEQMNAQGQLGQVIGQGIGQDQSLNEANANQFNAQQGLNAQLRMQHLGLSHQSQLQALTMSNPKGGGTGDGLMAGGATAAPMIMQWKQQQAAQEKAGQGS